MNNMEWELIERELQHQLGIITELQEEHQLAIAELQGTGKSNPQYHRRLVLCWTIQDELYDAWRVYRTLERKQAGAQPTQT